MESEKEPLKAVNEMDVASILERIKSLEQEKNQMANELQVCLDLVFMLNVISVCVTCWYLDPRDEFYEMFVYTLVRVCSYCT
jgi:hypothetical protein